MILTCCCLLLPAAVWVLLPTHAWLLLAAGECWATTVLFTARHTSQRQKVPGDGNKNVSKIFVKKCEIALES